MGSLLYDLQGLLDWLNNLTETEEQYEQQCVFRRAICAAIDEITFYKERDSVLKARGYEKVLDDAGMAWYQMKIARLNEILGIGFSREENHD